MRRRLFLTSTVGFALGFSSHLRADDGDIARRLVGVWRAKQFVNGMELSNQLTLTDNGEFAFT